MLACKGDTGTAEGVESASAGFLRLLAGAAVNGEGGGFRRAVAASEKLLGGINGLNLILDYIFDQKNNTRLHYL